MKAPIKRLTVESTEEVMCVLREHVNAICQIAVVEQVEIVPIKRPMDGLPPQKDNDIRLSAQF
jgi:hypothetical protein